MYRKCAADVMANGKNAKTQKYDTRMVLVVERDTWVQFAMAKLSNERVKTKWEREKERNQKTME